MSRIFQRKSADGSKPGKQLPRLAEAFSKQQHRCADWLQQKSELASERTKKICLLIFLVLSFVGSLGIVWRSLSASGSRSEIKIMPIAIPPATGDPSDRKLDFSKEGISKREYETILVFRRYLDSLSRTDRGRQTRDSILHGRPGLMDSLEQIENRYMNNQK